MKVLEGIEKLEIIKDIYSKLGIDFSNVTVEEAFSQYRNIVEILLPTEEEDTNAIEISGYYPNEFRFERKPWRFEDIGFATDESDVSVEGITWLNSLPVRKLEYKNPTPSDEIYGDKQYWVVSYKNEYYLVDTQGYDYARYCTRLTGFNLG